MWIAYLGEHTEYYVKNAQQAGKAQHTGKLVQERLENWYNMLGQISILVYCNILGKNFKQGKITKMVIVNIMQRKISIERLAYWHIKLRMIFKLAYYAKKDQQTGILCFKRLANWYIML